MPESLAAYLYADETATVENLLQNLPWDEDRHDRVDRRARDFVATARSQKRKTGELEAFFQQYGLDSQEGLALMCLAEALLRIPDSRTAMALIRDKISAFEWLSKNQGGPKDWLVRAAGLGLSVTRAALDSVASRLGEPVIRQAMMQAIRMLGKQFVQGETIRDALKNARDYEKKNYTMSYDMLGEGARTAADAERYFQAYSAAIEAIGQAANNDNNAENPGISVKLSALHPRYEFAHADLCVPALTAKLLALSQQAARHNLNLTVDAEEADRLELSLQIIRAVAGDDSIRGWNGFGLAVQAYQKRALPLIEQLIALARAQHRHLQIRLVKGAYWDSEIKAAQIAGLPEYPVFTRKVNTDLSYLACARKLLENRDAVYPMLATHNAHTVAAILELAGNDGGGFEFQRLHGMGEALHDQVLKQDLARVRIYAPVGSHEDLLPYLVRRLLENGANSSFVNQMRDPATPVGDIVADPVHKVRQNTQIRHPKIPLPANLYGEKRHNAMGLDLSEITTVAPLLDRMKTALRQPHDAFPLVGGKSLPGGPAMTIVNPAQKADIVGTVRYADDDAIRHAFDAAGEGFKIWSATDPGLRAAALDRLADLYEMHHAELMGLCVREAGKTVPDALAELREAVDFCRYYAMRGRIDFSAEGTKLPGPTGERNILTLEGRGTFVCISPWNFPLAIFTGQIAAALMAGNAVIAKPAEQTPLIAQRAVALMIEAGIPPQAIALLPGDGETGAKIVAHPDVAGVAFTGSTDAARAINRALAAKDGPIVPLIAETGGQNAMIVDSSALPEQVVDDAIVSAFGSTGQRCSALRVMFVQEEIADKIVTMLAGAMQELRVGDPMDLRTDTGPVIDRDALDLLQNHQRRMEREGKLIARAALPPGLDLQGHFFAPAAYEIPRLDLLEREIFGPILHIVRYRGDEIGKVIDAINATGYGLTLGIHSRIEELTNDIVSRVHVGNAYVNRTMIGAVVGVQPFGGMGLSGTGPKAGGPHYLHRFATEKVVSVNTTASGGNATLVSLGE